MTSWLGHQPLFQKIPEAQKMDKETGTTEDKTGVSIGLGQHQWMLWDPSDPSYKNRKKRDPILLIADTLG